MSVAKRYDRIVVPVLRWYRRNGRKLPWRGTPNPYRILLSEIMLQQTQVSRVLATYPEFIRRFPTFDALSRAKVRDVILAWRGMGYNARAVRLHALARAVVHRHRGRVPVIGLLNLPGIGRYTAHALLSAVHGLPVPVVEVNIRRFLSRVLFPMRTLDETRSEREMWQIAEALLPRGRAYDWNQAAMDMGSMVCTARRPLCHQCPVAPACASRPVMRRVSNASGKKEPGLRGVPNRIYRGRIVEELRRRDGHERLSARELGNRILGGYSDRNASWLYALLRGLESDGLIVVRRSRTAGAALVRLA